MESGGDGIGDMDVMVMKHGWYWSFCILVFG
jgi:hypothetical protein